MKAKHTNFVLRERSGIVHSHAEVDNYIADQDGLGFTYFAQETNAPRTCFIPWKNISFIEWDYYAK